jgi:hypothetical protein
MLDRSVQLQQHPVLLWRLRTLKNKEGRKLKKVKLENGNQVEVKKESGSQRLGEVIDLT